MKKILILSCNPRLDLPTLDLEVKDLKKFLSRLGKFDIENYPAVSSEDFEQFLLEEKPDILHFCGHGLGEEGLLLCSPNSNEAKIFSTEQLSDLFAVVSKVININCVVLNACDSQYQARVIVAHINYAIGMRQEILDKAAYSFAVGFYKGLGHGLSIEQAYELGRYAIKWGFSENSRTNRKLGSVPSKAQTSLEEHQKPILLAKSTPSSSSELQPSFLEQIKPKIEQEIERKDYKDHARAVYDNFGQFSAKRSYSLSPSDDKQLRVLLENVELFWIKEFLEPALKYISPINLDMKDSPDALEELSVDLDHSYDQLSKTPIKDEIGRGQTLLILGEPGAGKTIALLQLAKRLIERSKGNQKLRIPVLFNLSSWAKDRKPIFNWLVDELREKYYVPLSLSERWIHAEHLILLLDGLDEVKEEYRNDCVRKLNEFIVAYEGTEVAVCSRLKDYKKLRERLKISSALCLQPFSSEQVYQFLREYPGDLSGLIELLEKNVELEQFAKTPVILYFMSVAYQKMSLKELMNELHSKEEERKQHLLDTYIKRRLSRGSALEYPNEKVQFWLKCLATHMVREKQTIFLIENIQPNFLFSIKTIQPTCLSVGENNLNVQKWIYRIGVMFIVYLVVGLLFIPFIFDPSYNFKQPIGLLDILIFIPLALVCWGLISSLVFIFIHHWSDKKVYSHSKISNQPTPKKIISSLINGAIIGLITSSSYCILINFFSGYQWLLSSLFIYPLFSILLSWQLEIVHWEILEIKPGINLEPSLKKMGTNLFVLIIFLVLFSAIYEIRNLIVWKSLDLESLYKLILGFVSGGIYLIIANALKNSTNYKKKLTKPNQGIWTSAKNTLFFMIIGIPTAAIIGYVWATLTKFVRPEIGLMYSIASSLMGSILIFGQGSGIACIKHFTLRVILYFNQYIPWNYAKFLDFVSERLLMKKIGGGYIFFHRMLLEHIASDKYP